MRSNYNITGLFYQLQDYSFRKYLNIKKRNSNKSTPDLMVIMMNPGSSKPVDGVEDNSIETNAIPDRTQDQIIKVMLACKLEYARVLNLSDIREPKSNLLFSKLLEMDEKGIYHSIFDAKRKGDFDSLYIKDVPVIFAWGVSIKLQELAENAIKSIDADNPVGMAKDGLEWAYYHPLPQVYSKQKEWMDDIISLLK